MKSTNAAVTFTRLKSRATAVRENFDVCSQQAFDIADEMARSSSGTESRARAEAVMATVAMLWELRAELVELRKVVA